MIKIPQCHVTFPFYCATQFSITKTHDLACNFVVNNMIMAITSIYSKGQIEYQTFIVFKHLQVFKHQQRTKNKNLCNGYSSVQIKGISNVSEKC